MDSQKFSVDLIAWNLATAQRWLAEGIVSSAESCVCEARHYLHELARPHQDAEVCQRARVLIDWTADLITHVSDRLAPACREVLARELASQLGGAK